MWQSENCHKHCTDTWGCGLNMLMNFGACQAFHEEPANSFGKTLVMLGNSGQLTAKLTGAPRGPLVSLWPLLTSMPTLLVASKGDRVVPLERSTALEKWLKKLPERQVAISERWTNEDILGDGTAVKTLILEKALHCKAMISHAAEYWEAIDALVTQCLLAERWPQRKKPSQSWEETCGGNAGNKPNKNCFPC